MADTAVLHVSSASKAITRSEKFHPEELFLGIPCEPRCAEFGPINSWEHRQLEALPFSNGERQSPLYILSLKDRNRNARFVEWGTLPETIFYNFALDQTKSCEALEKIVAATNLYSKAMAFSGPDGVVQFRFSKYSGVIRQANQISTSHVRKFKTAGLVDTTAKEQRPLWLVESFLLTQSEHAF